MKVLLVLALLGAAVANHVPSHLEYPFFLTRHGESELPTVITESIVNQPVMVVTKTTRFAPEMMAILVEHGVNNLPENLESFHDVMRIAGSEEFTLCNAGHSGDVEICIERPITRLLVPEIYKDLTFTRILSDMQSMPWVRMPFYSPFTRSVPVSLSELEVFDKPILITRTFPVTHEFSEGPVLKSLWNTPLSKSLYTTNLFTDDSILKSYKPLSRSFLHPYSSLVKSSFLPKFTSEDAIIDSEIVKPLDFNTKVFTQRYLKSLNAVPYNTLVKSIKPIVRYEEVIANPAVNTAVVEKPIFKSIIAKPFFKNYDEVIAKPFFKSYDEVIPKHFLNKDSFSVNPVYKNFRFVEPVLPVAKSSSFFLPEVNYKTLY